MQSYVVELIDSATKTRYMNNNLPKKEEKNPVNVVINRNTLDSFI